MNAQTPHRGHRRRSISHARSGKSTGDIDHLRARIEHYATEWERRSRMTSKEAITQNALQLQRRIEREPSLTFLLQPTPPRHMARAQCCAGFCRPAKEAGKTKVEIKDNYRIVLTGSHIEREYFHVSCLTKMLDLPPLAPTRFRLDTDSYRWNDNWPCTWGLMLRKWFEHGGRVDLVKIADYINALKRYHELSGDIDTAYFDWQFQHECPKGRNPCECSQPKELEAPAEPTLSGYKTSENNICSLNKVLRHRYAEKLPSEINIRGIFDQDPSLTVLEREE